jgi:hypothetical protein
MVLCAWAWIKEHPWVAWTGAIAVVAAIGGTVKWWYEVKRLRREDKAAKREGKIPQVREAMEQSLVKYLRENQINLAGGYSWPPVEWFIEQLPKEDPELIKRVYSMHMEERRGRRS